MAASTEGKVFTENDKKQANPASAAVSAYMADMVNSRDMQEVIESQRYILEHFEKTNETLTRVNALTETRYSVLSGDFRNHITMLVDMKRSLDSIFKRIRVLKNTVKSKYPEAYETCKVTYVPPDDDDDVKVEDDENNKEQTDNS